MIPPYSANPERILFFKCDAATNGGAAALVNLPQLRIGNTEAIVPASGISQSGCFV